MYFDQNAIKLLEIQFITQAYTVYIESAPTAIIPYLLFDALNFKHFQTNIQPCNL